MGKKVSIDYDALNRWKRRYTSVDKGVVDEWKQLQTLCKWLKYSSLFDD